MKHLCPTNGNNQYWLSCDHCGDFTMQYDSRYELALEAMEAGWRHNTNFGKHFCTLTCELEYLAKLAKKQDPQYD